jgi:hypothetical protein
VRMHKHTYEAYKDMIKIDIKLLQLGLNITREKQEMLQKTDICGSKHFSGSVQLNVTRVFTSP